jgi:hypothetical protein
MFFYLIILAAVIVLIWIVLDFESMFEMPIPWAWEAI